MQTPTTVQLAHHHSLHSTNIYSSYTSTLVILPESETHTQSGDSDSIQQPSDPSIYTKLAVDKVNWRASGIIHDFNNQLAIILSHCSIALTKLPPDSKARANLERSIRATKRAAELSSQLHIGVFLEEEELIPTNLNDVIQEATAALEPTFVPTAMLETNYTSNLPAINSNAMLLHHVFINLFINAVEAMDKLDGTIQISTQAVEITTSISATSQGAIPAGHYVMAQITDSGVGMDQTLLDQIFTSFFSTKPTHIGLGLTMALQIVQLHKGIIRVYSTPDLGTTFQLFFPIDEPSEE